uniref:Zmp:0000001267 n=1 Tax=Sphaeramia orbicularis TaxID=375764 RepID=A0A673BYH7_9TELE
MVKTSAAAVTMGDNTQKLSLKREVGLVGAVSLIGGTMIGSGIFMSPQTVLSSIGSPGASLVVWASCGLLAILASFCYAELGTVIRESGGEYIYILRTSGPVVAFMLIFSSVLFVRPAGVAGIALSFAQYVVAPFYAECPPPVLVVKCVAAAAIIVLATVNCLNLIVKCVAAVSILVVAIVNSLNVRIAVRIQVIFLMAKILALAAIVIGGIVEVTQSTRVIVENLNAENAFKGTQYSLNTIGMAFYQGLWSYAGWYNLNYVTEELKRPEVNLPRAVVIAISLVTGLYLLVNVSYLTVMTPTELMSSNAVAVTWGLCGNFLTGTRC